MDKNERKITKQTLIVLGTSAIEIGIDFSCDYLIFEAITAASFLQRFGRIGRHKPGIAYLLGNSRESEAMNEPTEKSRDDFNYFINAVYDKNNSFSWFIKTEMGLFVGYCQFRNYINAVHKDSNLSDCEKKNLINNFEDWFEEFVKIIVNEKDKYEILMKRAKQFFNKKKYYKWPMIFINNNNFRSSFDSIKVYVKSEEAKNRNPIIKADILSILKKSKNLKYNQDKNRFEVDDFTEKNLITLNIEFIEEYSSIRTTNEDDFNELKLKQNDHLTVLSHYINLKNQLLIFLPKECIRNIDFDWRFQAIYCADRKSIAVIGDNVLLLKELFKKIDNCKIPEDNFL
jgi:CRISPR/Cas system-associated endonuclease/helicase Cas3